jgi:hypothetical protein
MTERMKASQSVQEAIHAMTSGNPGSMSVLNNIMQSGDVIDPDDMMGGFGTMLSMDMAEIHDTKIWELYKSCGKDLVGTVACMRAYQLGVMSKKEIHDAIESHAKLNVSDIVAKVQEEFPNFGTHPSLQKKVSEAFHQNAPKSKEKTFFQRITFGLFNK